MLGAQKKKATAITSESRAHELLYGDALKQPDQKVYRASDGTEFHSATSRDKYEAMLKENTQVDSINDCLNALVQNSDPEVITLTAKTLLKIIANLLKANTTEDKEKFGCLRLTNKAIIKRFVNVPHAVELLESVGFMKTLKDNEDVMSFSFSEKNLSCLTYLRTCINQYVEESHE